jgi:hypothetical protein
MSWCMRSKFSENKIADEDMISLAICCSNSPIVAEAARKSSDVTPGRVSSTEKVVRACLPRMKFHGPHKVEYIVEIGLDILYFGATNS